jgi:hypothetical protein
MGARTLLGLPDAELDQAWLSQAQLDDLEAKLERRSCLVNHDGRLRLAANLVPLLGPMMNPTACLAQGYLDCDSARHLIYYWQPPHLVSMQRLNQENWRIERLSQVTDSWPLLAAFWRTPGGGVDQHQRVLLPQPVFNLAKGCLDHHQSDEFVKQLGVWRTPTQVAEALADTLLEPQSQASLCAFERVSDGWALEGYSFLRGTQGWWRTRPCQRNKEPWIEISQVSAEDAGERASSLLKRMLRV